MDAPSEGVSQRRASGGGRAGGRDPPPLRRGGSGQVCVMAAGRPLEYAPPQELAGNPDSEFAAMLRSARASTTAEG
jgi:hypothetical protein